MNKKSIKILFIGDVCGKPGRQAISQQLPTLRKKHKIDLVIANIDNLAHGKGATVDTVRELMSYGVDYMTAGDHVWRRKEYEEVLNGELPVVRAVNYPDDVPGRSYAEIDLGSKGRVLLIQLMGCAFMNERTASEPFRCIRDFLRKTDTTAYSAIIVDFHAEATSEKVAMGFFLDGKVSAVLGTHTHVPTADERILQNGTAFISDVGMAGPLDAILWVKQEIIFQQNMYPFSPSYEIEEEGKLQLDAVLCDITSYRNATMIRRINIVC